MQAAVFSFNAPPPSSRLNSSPFSSKTHHSNSLFFTSTINKKPSILSTEIFSRKLICKPPAGKYIGDDYLVFQICMAASTVTFSGYHPKLTFRNRGASYRISKLHHGITLPSRNQNPRLLYSTTRTSSAGGNYQPNNYDGGDSNTYLLFLSQITNSIRHLPSLFRFLVEQPSQLKYIEWPSFQSTLKTAMLTLVLVAMLIVALSSVDSALTYLLALLLRKKA